MRYVLYTTESPAWYQERANNVAKAWSQTKGRGECTIEVKRIAAPKTVERVVDELGNNRIAWDWFRTYFPKEDYDGVFAHFTPTQRDAWKLTRKDGKSFGGSRNGHNREYPEFWVCTRKEGRAGYDISNFERILYHEMAHFDEDLDNDNLNLLTQTSVHTVDYELQKIHLYHLLVDYRGYHIKQAVNRIMVKIINLAKKFL